MHFPNSPFLAPNCPILRRTTDWSTPQTMAWGHTSLFSDPLRPWQERDRPRPMVRYLWFWGWGVLVVFVCCHRFVQRVAALIWLKIFAVDMHFDWWDDWKCSLWTCTLIDEMLSSRKRSPFSFFSSFACQITVFVCCLKMASAQNSHLFGVSSLK